MLELNVNNKAVKDYYKSLDDFDALFITKETAVRSSFQHLLEYCCKQTGLKFVPEYPLHRKGRKALSVDGAMLDAFSLPHAYWEAKDIHDDLQKEVEKKLALGYPKDNILFQTPERAILWQNGRQVDSADITHPGVLVNLLKEVFNFRQGVQHDWETAVDEFKPKIPELAKTVVALIDVERKDNKKFVQAFNSFATLCRTAINPNLSDMAVEEMLVQHLLTERIFRKVFHRSDFTSRNIIAAEIEQVIKTLISRKFSRDEFLRPLDRFYVALEKRAEALEDYHQKQHFLNTVYENFFQGFALNVADTHGIVYTPQPIVDFMVRSVEEILQAEFGKSLGDKGVNILDPFVGTGNFITRVMREIKKTQLEYKFSNELHCNEVMLLPYYIASMNIEHQFYEITGEYKQFEGICLVDTFELAEAKEDRLGLFTEKNSERVKKQQNTPLFVIIGNPPYNANQANENDNNKNREYPAIQKRVKDTYIKDSKARLLNKTRDPYVKAMRWASDKIGENGEGVVAFVTNNSFLDAISLDGMRGNLLADFDSIYILDLGGNIRSNPKLSGTKHNVFGIQVGVSVNFLIKRKMPAKKKRLLYARMDEFATQVEKLKFLQKSGSYAAVDWKPLTPSAVNSWLNEGLEEGFGDLLKLGEKAGKGATNEDTVFDLFSLGVATNRDSHVYSFNQEWLKEHVKGFVEIYNQTVDKAKRKKDKFTAEEMIDTSDTGIKWTRQTKAELEKGKSCALHQKGFRHSLYRPYTKMHLYFDNFWNEEQYRLNRILPVKENEKENRVICISGIGSSKPFQCLMTNIIPDLHLMGDTQCFPLYTYDENGTSRKENISDWALRLFREKYGKKVCKEDIFYYTYGLLHSPQYREKYKANLWLELPRLPVAKDVESFQAFVKAGKKMADLHVNFEQQKEYPLERVEATGEKLNWRVEKVKFNKDKTAIIYNDFLTLASIPPKAHDYRLGNRSALEWIVDQYQVSVDARSGIKNDPNEFGGNDYIVNLICKVVTVSIETVKIVENLPDIE